MAGKGGGVSFQMSGPPPNPQNDPKAYAAWINANPNASQAEKIQAKLIEKYGSLSAAQDAGSQRIIADFGEDEAKRIGYTPATFELPAQVETTTNGEPVTTIGTEPVSREAYYRVMDLPETERLQALVNRGLLPQGSQQVINEQGGVTYLLPEQAEATTERIRYEGGINVLVNNKLAEVDDKGRITVADDAFVQALDNPTVKMALDDTGFGKVKITADGKTETLSAKEYGQAVLGYREAVARMESATETLRDYINDDKTIRWTEAVDAGLDDPKLFQDAGYGITADDINSYKRDMEVGSYENIRSAISQANTERDEAKRQQDIEEAVVQSMQEQPNTEDKTWQDVLTGETYTESERDKLVSEYEAERDRLMREGKMYTDEWIDLGRNPLDSLVAIDLGTSRQRISDAMSEAMSLGAVETATFNRSSIGKQYDQQKAITLATFLGDTEKLGELYRDGYFGRGKEAEKYYQDSLNVIRQQNDIEKAVNNGDLQSLQQLKDDGAFGDDEASYTNLVTYVSQGGRELSPVTPDDVKAVSDSLGTKKEYTDAVLQSMPSLGRLASEFGIALVPIWGTIHNWDKMGGLGKGASIVADVVSFIPIAAGVSAAAKTAASVGRMARLAAGLKVVPKLAFTELIAPVTSMLHPVETAKAIGTTAKGLLKVLDPRHIPGAGLATTYGTVRLDLSILGDREATMLVRDQLMALQAAGKKPIVQFGDKIFTLRSGSFLSEGGLVHASPNIRFVGDTEGFVVTTKVYPEGHPQAGQRVRDSEQGMFVANNALERFTASSAFGFEGAGKTDKIKAITDAVEQATTAGDTRKAAKLQELVDDYNEAISTKNIKMLDKAEARITSTLSDMATDEIVARVNTSLRTANERYIIGDVRGAQDAMQEAIAYEKQLQSARPGFAVFSPEIAQITVPSGKLFPGMVFKPKLGEIWSITVTEMKRDKAAKLLQQASDAERLGDKATAARLTKEAHDYINSGKSGFRKTSGAELELKFPELTQIKQMKPRYTTMASDTGATLWIYTDKPYSFAKALKAKAMAPIDTLRNIFEPAISVKTIPMTRSQRLSKIEDLLQRASDMEKAGNVEEAAILRTEARVLENTIEDAARLSKSASKTDDVTASIARAKRMDDADELIQASKRAEMSGDFESADRLRRAADRIAGRRYVDAVIRRVGTVSGLVGYGRAMASIRTGEGRPLGRETGRTGQSRSEARRGDTERVAGLRATERLRRPDISRQERIGTERTSRGTDLRSLRELSARTGDLRGLREPEAQRTPGDDRLLRTPETTRLPDTTRTPRTPGEQRTPIETRVPEQPRAPREPRDPRTPREPRVPDEAQRGYLQLSGTEAASKRFAVPRGSITWKQGTLWKWIPREDFRDGIKPRTLPRGVVPDGVTRLGRTPQETIQVIGGGSVPDIRADLGKTDLFITDNASEISFSGHGEQTDVGKRVSGATTGMTVDAKGHAYAGEYYPQHSVSRTDMSETVMRGTEAETRGVNRPEAIESREKIIEKSKTVSEQDEDKDKDKTKTTIEYLDEDEAWLDSLEPLPVKKRPANRTKLDKKRTSRRGRRDDDLGDITSLRGFRP